MSRMNDVVVEPSLQETNNNHDDGHTNAQEEVEIRHNSARKPLVFSVSTESSLPGFIGSKNKKDTKADLSLLEELEEGDDNNDDDSSLSSSLSSDDDDEEEQQEVEEETLMEKVTRNRRRNALFLETLNAKYKGVLPEKNLRGKRKKEDEYDDDECDDREDHSPKGMLRKGKLMKCQAFDESIEESSSSATLPQRINCLLKHYPGREQQIRRLTSMILSTTSQLHSKSLTSIESGGFVHVPPPMLVVGPRGAGKTSVVCDVVQTIRAHEKQQQLKTSSPVGYAYIDCNTLDPYNIEGFVHNAYTQLRPEEYVNFKKQRRRLKRMRTRRKKQKLEVVVSKHVTVDSGSSGKHPNNIADETTTDKEVKDCNESAHKTESSDPIDLGGGEEESSNSLLEQQSQQQENVDTTNERKEKRRGSISSVEEDRRRVQPRRTVKAPTSQVVNTRKPTTNAAALKLSTGGGGRGNGRDDSVDISSHHSVVISFGRALNAFYGEGCSNSRCAILVIDNGELLLSLSSRKQQSTPKRIKTNFLAELLLLPKVMRLNLTVIVISRYSNIDNTRLNNITSATKSLSTISSGVQPILVQFPAYKGNKVFKKILSSESIVQQTLGNDFSNATNENKDGMNPFRTRIMDAFHNALIQYLADSTRDIRDFIRLGRSYWPVFIEPLSDHQIQKTMNSIRRRKKSDSNGSPTSAEVVTYLEQRFFSSISTLPGTILGTAVDSPILSSSNNSSDNKSMKRPLTAQGPSNILPYYRSFLLLSAFICQRNRPEQDKHFFSTQRNGKRRKSGNSNQSGKGDDAAFASDAMQLQSLRPRPFPLERVFSVFVSLLNLNPPTERQLVDKPELDEYSLGSIRLHDDIAQLIDMGHLHLIRFDGAVKGEQININNAKLWCSLTTEEAMQIAETVQVPLQNFIL